MDQQKTEPAGEIKPVLLRLPMSIYTAVVREAGKESTRRGVPISVPKLLLEIVTDWLKGRPQD